MLILGALPFVLWRLYEAGRAFRILLLAIALSCYFVVVRPFSTEFLEAGSIKTATFSVNYLATQLPQYLSAWFNTQSFGPTLLLLLLVTSISIFNNSTISKEGIVCLGFAIGFLALYGLHYRSSYFVLTGEISEFDTYRYSNNFFFLLVVATTAFLHGILRKIESVAASIIPAALLVFYPFGVLNSYGLGNELREEEQRTRIQPVMRATEAIRSEISGAEQAVLISATPIVAKLSNEHDRNIVHGEYREDDIVGAMPGYKTYYLLTDNSYTRFRDRLEEDIEIVRKSCDVEGFVLVRIVNRCRL